MRPWTHIFVVHSEPGEQMFKDFDACIIGGLVAKFGPDWMPTSVPGGLQIHFRESSNVMSETSQRSAGRLYNAVSCWSVFDRLDLKHKLLLTMSTSDRSPNS